jgi:hypothetical protein
VDAGAVASAADGEGGNGEREGEVGVGGADVGFGGDLQVAVDGFEAGEEWGVGGKVAGGAVADAFGGEAEGCNWKTLSPLPPHLRIEIWGTRFCGEARWVGSCGW